jgi:hypothetical protein
MRIGSIRARALVQRILSEADPADKLEVYQRLGLRLTYDHETEMVVAETEVRAHTPRALLVSRPCPHPASVSTAWTMRRNDLLFLLAILRSMRAENFG